MGVQVMLIKNMDETLVNGTMGKIIGFVDPAAALDDDAGKPSSKGGKEPKATASLGSRQLLPMVEFLQPGGLRRQVIIQPDTWKVELPNGEVQVSRTQVRDIRNSVKRQVSTRLSRSP